MTALSMENPVFVSYVVAAAIMILKLMGQGWMTVFKMVQSDGGLLNPEDLLAGPANRNPRPEQLQPYEPVERSRRMHRNDIENIPAFLAAGLIFVAAQPSLVFASIVMTAFVVARLAHTVAYATGQRHEVRATFFTVGSVAVIVMTLYALVVAVA